MGTEMARKRALLIGVNQYHLLSNLAYARQDAEAVADALCQHCGFSDQDITLMTCQAEGACMGLSRYIEHALMNLTDERNLDLLVFGFWGHGFAPQAGRRYLCGMDTAENDLERTAVSFDVVKAKLAQVGAENTLLLLDCCQNRPTGRSVSGSFMTRGEEQTLASMARDIQVTKRDLGRTSLPTVAILNACREGQRAYEWDSRGHGIFTAHLLDAFEQGLTSVAPMTSWLFQRVTKTTRELHQQAQTPYVTIEGKGDIVFSDEVQRNRAGVVKVASGQPATVSAGSSEMLRTELAPEVDRVRHEKGFGSYQLEPEAERAKLECAKRLFERHVELARTVYWEAGTQQVEVEKNDFVGLFSHAVVQESVKAGVFCNLNSLRGFAYEWAESGESSGQNKEPRFDLIVSALPFLRASCVPTKYFRAIEKAALEQETRLEAVDDYSENKEYKLIYWPCRVARLWASLREAARSQRWLQYATRHALEYYKQAGPYVASCWHSFLGDVDTALSLCDRINRYRSHVEDTAILSIELAETLWQVSGDRKQVRSLLNEAAYAINPNGPFYPSIVWNLRSLARAEVCLFGDTSRAVGFLNTAYSACTLLSDFTKKYYESDYLYLAREFSYLDCLGMVRMCLDSAKSVSQRRRRTYSLSDRTEIARTAYLVEALASGSTGC